VVPDGLGGEEEPPADGLIREALTQQDQDLMLPRRRSPLHEGVGLSEPAAVPGRAFRRTR
jgi:hypothetical protein